MIPGIVAQGFGAQDAPTYTTLHAIFTASGSFPVPDGVSSVDVLIVAGGGGGGSRQGGGGGAGGVRLIQGLAVSPLSSVDILVGAGGAGGTNGGRGANGGNSAFGAAVSLGGGGGGGRTSGFTGESGGSGGGGWSQGGAGTSDQGNNGGNGTSSNVGGGGGGKGAAGQAGTGTNNTGVAGAGGAGAEYPEFAEFGGSPAGWFGGGGGGSISVTEPAAIAGAGGIGGGGAGAPTGVNAPGTAGTANTGGGGGASNQAGYAGGAGGSGIVIVRYQVQSDESAELPSAGLLAWYDADRQTEANATRIASLVDHSGNENTFTISGPGARLRYNERNHHKVFSNESNVIGGPNFLQGLASGSMFIVHKARMDPTSGADRGPWQNYGNDAHHLPFSNGLVYEPFGTTSRKSFNPAGDLAKWHIYNAESAANLWTARVNGTVEFTTTSNTVGFGSSTMYFGGSNFFGRVAEVLFYDHVLSEADRQAVEGYLAEKYDLADRLPVSHPYYQARTPFVPPAYRYFRIVFLENNAGSTTTNNTSIGELRFKDGGGNNIAGTGTASSTLSSSYLIQYAFDGNTSTFWASGGSERQNIVYDLGAGNSAVLSSVEIRSRGGGFQSQSPKDFIIEGSNDAVTWTRMLEVDGQDNWSDSELRTFTL